MATARPSPVWYVPRRGRRRAVPRPRFDLVELLVAERLGTDEREDRLDEARVDVLAGPAVRVAVVQRERDRHRGEHRCDPVCQPGRRQQRLLIRGSRWGTELTSPRRVCRIRGGRCTGRSARTRSAPDITSPELRSEVIIAESPPPKVPGRKFSMSASASATRSSKTTFPSSVEMSRVTDCLLRPRYFHQSPTPSFWGPKWRRWSPVSGCSTLITSAPKSASRRPTVPIGSSTRPRSRSPPSRGRRGSHRRPTRRRKSRRRWRVATHKGLPGVSTPPWAVRAVRSIAVRVLSCHFGSVCGRRVVLDCVWSPRPVAAAVRLGDRCGFRTPTRRRSRPPRRRPDRERPCASATRSPRALVRGVVRTAAEYPGSPSSSRRGRRPSGPHRFRPERSLSSDIYRTLSRCSWKSPRPRVRARCVPR